jgi:short-subunit dehydrogenase
MRPIRPIEVTGARCLVTGASSGIGRATALALRRAGAIVAVTGRDADALAVVAASSGGPAIARDLTEPGAPEAVVKEAIAALGRLDVLVSNAGAGWAGHVTAMGTGDIDALIDLNLRAPIQLTQAALVDMSPRRRGHLVFVGSIAGRVGAPGEAVYSATKAGLRTLTEMLRAEMTPLNIGVSLVSPGVVDTPFFARRNHPYARRFPKPISADRVADTIVRCLQRGTSEAIVPRWLVLPARLHGGFPGMYAALAEWLAPGALR